MKITRNVDDLKDFKDVSRGAIFEYNMGLYMKVSDPLRNTRETEIVNAVDIETGELLFFHDDDGVKVINNYKFEIKC